MTSPKLTALVQATLKSEARSGKTTKRGASALVWMKFEKLGGPTTFGIGRAAVTAGCMYYINRELDRQLKTNLTDHEIQYVLPSKIPDELKTLVGRLPRWFSIEDGPDAIWIHWQSARPEHVRANYELKRKKAEQTMRTAILSRDLANYMEAHSIATLGQIFREKDV